MTALPVGAGRAVRAAWRVTLGRALAALTILGTVALLPWFSGIDAARTVLRARTGGQDATADQLDAVRAELGLAGGPLPHLRDWFAGLVRGDLGRSWVSGDGVLPQVLQAVGVSLTLVLGAFFVTTVVAALVCARTVSRGARGEVVRPSSGLVAAALAALPKFVLASLLATVVGVWLGWFPAQGWTGPASMVLPGLALGIPSGAVIGGLLDEALPASFLEPWVRTWRAAGFADRTIGRAVLRRAVAGVLPQLVPTVVALVGGAVAVEQIFNIPGLGRLALTAATAQDLPLLQGCVLVLVLLGGLAGIVLHATRRTLLGPALTQGGLPAQRRPEPAHRRVVTGLTLGAGGLLAAAVGWGLARDPHLVDPAARLLAPSLDHPLGTDSLGRDLLARLGHGAATTVGAALVVTVAAVVIGAAVGLSTRVGAGATDVVATLPAVLAGMTTAAVVGPSTRGAALAVLLVAWTPYAAHAAALVAQERAGAHLAAATALGARPTHLLRIHLLPAVVPPLVRNALLRLPTTVLVLASLGFLGLGAQPPAPEWGRLLAEGQPYVELAPWTVLGPAGALVLLSVLAVGAPTAVRARGGAGTRA